MVSDRNGTLLIRIKWLPHFENYFLFVFVQGCYMNPFLVNIYSVKELKVNSLLQNNTEADKNY